MTPFKITTSNNGEFMISAQSITHTMKNLKEVSKGLLVSRHFTSVQRALFTAFFLAEGNCYESLQSRGVEPDENVPRLLAVLDAMEWQVNSFTDGEYKKFTETYDAHRTVTAYHLWHEMENVFMLINDLRVGRYNEKTSHRRIPLIETIGRKLVDSIMDLVWHLDNEESSAQEEVDAALTKFGKLFS